MMKDWADHLTTIFPEVRLKKYLEMRGADSGPWRRLCALPAFWVGLLYDQAALDAAWDLVKDWTAEERQALRDAVPKQALNAMIRGRTVRDIARDVLTLSRAGLEARGQHGCKGKTRGRLPRHAGRDGGERKDRGGEPAGPLPRQLEWRRQAGVQGFCLLSLRQAPLTPPSPPEGARGKKRGRDFIPLRRRGRGQGEGVLPRGRSPRHFFPRFPRISLNTSSTDAVLRRVCVVLRVVFRVLRVRE